MVPTTTDRTITSACLSHAHELWTRYSPTQGGGLSNEACQQPCMTSSHRLRYKVPFMLAARDPF